MTPAMLTRRAWLAAMAACAGAQERPRILGQIYVWTQQFARERKALVDGVPEALAGFRAAGFSGVELMFTLFTPGTRDKTLAGLRDNQLECPIVYDGGPMHQAEEARKTIEHTLRLAESIRPAGARIINFNPNPKPRREPKTGAELETQAQFVNRLADELAKTGVQLILHHHDPEMADNAREWRHLLKNTSARLCLDLHWVYRGGQNPLALLREARDRVVSLHLRNSRQGVWTEDFGPGDVDYRAIAAYWNQSRFGGYLVVELAYENETQITRGLVENLRLSREFTESTFSRTAGSPAQPRAAGCSSSRPRISASVVCAKSSYQRPTA